MIPLSLFKDVIPKPTRVLLHVDGMSELSDRGNERKFRDDRNECIFDTCIFRTVK